jgi:protein-tyrosine phosphatase
VLSFFKAKPKGIFDISKIAVDMHSHLIPGIDDGAKTISEAVDLIRSLKALGYQKIITTPHVYQEYYPNTKAVILRGYDTLQKVLLQEGITIPTEVAAEYFLDDYFESLLAKNEILPLNGRYILVEMSFYGASPKLYEYLFQIQTKGYIPILAHPERYLYFRNNIDEFVKLKQAGCLLQMNILSITGYYNEQVKHLAYKLLDNGLIDLLGTDLHHHKHLEAIKHLDLPSKNFDLMQAYPFKNRELLL